MSAAADHIEMAPTRVLLAEIEYRLELLEGFHGPLAPDQEGEILAIMESLVRIVRRLDVWHSQPR